MWRITRGTPTASLGPEMMAEFRRQAERFGTEFITDDVTKVDFSERPHRVWVGDDEYRAETVIVATGATARQLGLDSERRLQGRGVSYCATCDAAFFPDKHVVVVGGGDSAMEEASFLARFAAKVTIVHRRDEFRASQIMIDRARANDKIEWVTNAVVDEVLGDARVTGVRLRDVNTDETWEIDADGVFAAIGHDPEHGALPRPARARRGRLPDHEAALDGDERAGRLRRRRRAGPRLPAGGHRRRLRAAWARSTRSGTSPPLEGHLMAAEAAPRS